MSTTITTTAPRTAPPGDLAMWFFILAELLVFGVFFLAYAIARMGHPELFAAGQQHLDVGAGLFNTVALLTGSWLVARALEQIRQGDVNACMRHLIGAVAMGALFVGVKLYEYAGHLSAGISLSTDLFYMFYLSLTFFHFMHVLMAMIIVAAVAWKARAGAYDQWQHTGVETGAVYWHMVDLVWLILFPLVYVIQ